MKQNISSQYTKESTALRDFKYSKNFIKYSNDTDDFYKNIEE